MKIIAFALEFIHLGVSVILVYGNVRHQSKRVTIKRKGD